MWHVGSRGSWWGVVVLVCAAACGPGASRRAPGGAAAGSAGAAGGGTVGGGGGSPSSAGGQGGGAAAAGGSGGGGGSPSSAGGQGGGAPAGKTALYVVGDEVLLSPGEEVIQFRLESRGFATSNLSGGFATAQDATGVDLLVLSDAPPSMVINTTFRDVTTPTVCMERNLFDDMGMTGQAQGVDYGDDPGISAVVVNPNSVMGKASGLAGNVVIAFEGGMVGWGATLGAAADRAVTNAGAPTHHSLFGYKKGDAMPGLAAPAHRVGYGPWTPTVANFTEEGLKLFDAAVDYALTP